VDYTVTGNVLISCELSLPVTCKFFTPSQKPTFHHKLSILSSKQFFQTLATENKCTTFQVAAPYSKAIRRVRQIRHLLQPEVEGPKNV
jgi:hypothetical protein